MKNFRLLVASLIASAVVTLAPAQPNEDIASLRAKAEKGNGIAQYNLGLAYAEGHGVATDRIEAFLWLSIARENGARGRALDTLTAAMDPATLTAARQRLAEFKGNIEGKIPVVTTARSEPEIVTTIKTTGTSTVDAASLTQQVAALTADKKQLSEEVAKAWKEIDALNAALGKAENDVRSAATQTASAAELQNLSKFSRELEASLTRTNEQKTALEKNLAANQAELARTKAELAIQSEKADKLAAAETARLTPSAEIVLLRNQLSAAQSQVSALSTDLATVRASETRLHDNVAQLEQEKAQLVAPPAHPDLSERVGELEAQLARANRNLEATTVAATAVSKQSAADLSASAAQILRLQRELAAKSAEPTYPDLSGKVRELETALTDSNLKLAAAAQIQATLKQQLADSSSTAQNSVKIQEEQTQLRRERDELASRANTLASENEALRTDRERIQKSLAESSVQIRNSAADVKRIKELEDESATLRASLASTKSSAPTYPDLSGKVQELQNQLTAATQQADAAKRTAATASKQSADLTAATTQIAQLQAALAAKSAAPTAPDLSGRVKELESELTAAASETSRAKQEIAALSKARDEALKNRGPVYPNLAGRVVELQTALADAKRDLTDTQAALRAAEQAHVAAPAAVAVTAEPAATTETSDLQKQLAETENKLATALRGYALLQRDVDAKIDTATKGAEATKSERDSLTTQVATLTAEVERLKSGTSDQAAAAQAEITRAHEALGALQRSTAQNATDLAAARALLQQMQGAHTVLANENYQLKARLNPGSQVTPPNASATPVLVPVLAPVPAARTHVVAAGDTLSRISQRYYGSPGRWQEIYKANTTKLGANGVLRVGTELVIP